MEDISLLNEEGIVVFDSRSNSFFGRIAKSIVSIREGFKEALEPTRKKVALTVGAVTVMILAACGGEDKSPQAIASPANKVPTVPEQTENTPTIESTFTVEPEPTKVVPTADPENDGGKASVETNTPESATSTSEPTATATERVQEVPCRILPEQFCSQAKIVEHTTLDGNQMTLVGLNLPEGTPLFSIYRGDADISDSRLSLKLNGKILSVSSSASEATGGKEKYMLIYGDVIEENLPSQGLVDKGAQIGSVGGNGTTNLDNYNILIRFMTSDSGELVVDNELIEELFPGIFGSTSE